MLTLASRRGLLRDRLVFFADRDESRAILERVAPHEVVRLRHALADLRSLGLQVPVSETRTSWIDLTGHPDALLASMKKTCRYEIRRATRIRDRFTIQAGERAAEDFLRLYNEFVTWKGYTHPMRARRYRDYLALSDVHVAYLDGEPLVGHLNLRDEQTRRVRLAFSASNRSGGDEHRRLAGWVNRYLHWHEMLTYCGAGFETYDFGGVGDGRSSVARFKLSFGGEVEIGQSCVLAGPLARGPVAAFERIARVRRTVARGRAARRHRAIGDSRPHHARRPNI
jgi:lipid II:glycine glycyltransferase (peptidoglycan interpeptide bridge formation enzyme)